MQAPLLYQVSEYDCVPTTMINAVSYLFHRREIPPMVIRHIYLYCLDTVGRDSRLGIGGTSKYAVRLVGNWLSSYKIRHFSVETEFLEREAVNIEPGGSVETWLEDGGVALCNILLTLRDEHYIMVMDMDKDWIYAFDPYRRRAVRGMQGNVRILEPGDTRSPNVKIKRAWFAQQAVKRICLGPLHQRECLLIRRSA